MSGPAVWRSPPPGHQVPMQPYMGAQNAAPPLHLLSQNPQSGQVGFPSWQTSQTNDMNSHPMQQCSQPKLATDGITNQNNHDLPSVIQNLTRVFEGHLAYLREEMCRAKDDARRREELLESQIFDLREELRQMRECFVNNQPPEPRMQPFSHKYFPGPQQGFRPRKFWPKIEKAPDTPTANKYLDECTELDKCLKECRSLAVPDAKCSFIEHVGNLFDAEQDVKIHAVGADLSLGVGVAADAVKFAGRPDCDPNSTDVGGIIKQDTESVGSIWHLVTKEKSSYKLYKKPEPFVQNVKKAFKCLAEEIKKQQLEEVAMSYLCSGSDRMNRVWIMQQLYEELCDVPVKVHFYNKFQSKRWQGCGQLFSAQPETPLSEDSDSSEPHSVVNAVNKEAAKKKAPGRPKKTPALN